MDKDEAVRSQQDRVNFDALEAEIEISTRSKVEKVIEQLPKTVRYSRSRATDAEAFKKQEGRV